MTENDPRNRPTIKQVIQKDEIILMSSQEYSHDASSVGLKKQRNI